MNHLLNNIKIGVSILGTFFTWFFGAWDTALQVLVVFMVLDYLTGVLRAYINKEVSSDIGFKGIAKKTAIFVALIVAVLLDRLTNTGIYVFRTLFCYFFISNEGISILENCECLGITIPKPIKDALVQLKDGEKKSVNKE